MYIGSTGPKGLHHLVFEIVDNSVDEAMAGYCDSVLVELLPGDGVRVTDNGRGIPCDVHPRTGMSALETVLTVLHAGGKFGGESSGYKVSGGLHGVGVSVVNALSANLTAEVWRDNMHHKMVFNRGLTSQGIHATASPQPIINSLTSFSEAEKMRKKSEKIKKKPEKKSGKKTGKNAYVLPDLMATVSSGTSVTFYPDPLIFTGGTTYHFDSLKGRLHELAYLNPGIRLILADKRSEEGKTSIFEHKGGIQEMVRDMCDGRSPLHSDLSRLTFNGTKDGIEVEIAIQWSKDQYSDSLVSFANNIRTGDGGTHIDGLTRALTRVVNTAARKAGKRKQDAPNIGGEYIREGITAVVNMDMKVRAVVDNIVSENLLEILLQRPRALSALIDKASSAQAAAQAARAARDLVRKKSKLASTVLPGKLADCSERNPADREIFIVEGDSAAGSAKQGRNRRHQAILPLRGKILNVEKASTDQLYSNSELQALITALGLGIKGSDNFQISKLRYGRIIIMTDADVDGAHIRMLLLTFLYRYRREIVSHGSVYIACPPLYKVGDGAKAVYTWDEEGLEEIKRKNPRKALNVQRFKGLGEMMPKQLWDTTMNPETRRLQQVTVRDLAEADRMFTLLMGDKVGPRKEFIMANSKDVALNQLQL
ncbi:hypothetical protein AAMO2058_001064300 [Amorphochlora amoebiformis]